MPATPQTHGEGGAEFAGTARFAVRRRLGAGGLGVVYEAWDGERRAPVALKTLHRLDAAAIYRLKREFRALADVAHPNLVSLHELFSEAGRWFFTMELVDGCDFLRWVRPGFVHATSHVTSVTGPATSEESGAGRPPPPDAAPAQAPAPGVLSEERLRAALGQLALAVGALHDSGRLHRDLKPSNVLVQRDGRLVVLDFGLATELRPASGDRSTEQGIAGTPLYMAPEQAAMEPLGMPSDWYAVGAMLYEALTGQPPFAGSQLQILMNKQTQEPRPVLELAPDAPADLAALCTRLLARRPEDRPAAAEVLQLLGQGRAPAGASQSRTGASTPLVGQHEVLGALREAFAQVRRGEPVTVFLSGGAGVGISAVARCFAEEVERDAGAVVLTGRCYERESVPFKALDSLVDALSRHLVRMPRLEAEALLPRDVRALARMFPVLSRVPAIAASPRRDQEMPDLQELRERASAALRELLGRSADRQPLVLVIDGLQWSDSDSALLLAGLLRPPQAPAMLLVACYRSGDARTIPPGPRGAPGARPGQPEQRSPLALLRAQLVADCAVRDLEVHPLPEAQARELAAVLLGQAGLPAVHAEAVARESRGNPFFAGELVRALQVGGDRWSPAAGVTLEEALSLRLEQLPAPARALLEVAAVSGGPTQPLALASAANHDGDTRALFSLLRAAHLLRTSGDGERVETYHDRIREIVVRSLGPARLAELHGRLAAALEAAPGPRDAAALAHHLAAAGAPERAAEFAAEAAGVAAQALAFERAVRFYRLALVLREPGPSWGQDLEARLGDALANAGLGAEAARCYLAAAARSWTTKAFAIELRRKAAEQYLRSGHIDDGLGVLRDVLANFGMAIATSPRRAFLSLVVRRVQVTVRGTRFEPRDPSQISAEQLARIDLCWAVAVGLGMVDVIRASAFQARHLLLALEAGEPMRVARALCAEAAFVATPGGARAQRAARELAEQGRELGRRIDNPQVIALASFCGAIVDFVAGRWRSSREQADRAAELFRARCTGVAWEVSNSQLFSLWSLFYLGELGELRSRVGALLREARTRGDLYAATSFRTGLSNVAFLVDDDVEGARREVADVLGLWSSRGFHFQHYYCLLAQGITDLYCEQGAAAHARIEAQWPLLEQSMMLRIENVAIEATHLRVRAALGALEVRQGDPALLATIARGLRTLRKLGTPWSRAVAVLLEAGLLRVQGESARAAGLFEDSGRQMAVLDLALFAVAANRRAGELRGGPAGEAAVAAADAALRAQGIKNPRRMAAMLAP